MAKLVASEFVTLDGVFEDPHLWSMNYWNDDLAAVKQAELDASESQLLGRVTYEGYASSWPSMNDNPFGEKFNAMPKYVVTSSREPLAWNNSHRLGDDLVAEVTKLKQQPGGDIWLSGSAQLLRTLLEHDLVDELRLIVYPLLRGQGKHLFENGTLPSKNLQLVETRPVGSDVVLMVYGQG